MGCQTLFGGKNRQYIPAGENGIFFGDEKSHTPNRAWPKQTKIFSKRGAQALDKGFLAC
jgi:hypothetical protein